MGVVRASAVVMLTACAAAQHPFVQQLEGRLSLLQRKHRVPGIAVALFTRGETRYVRGFGTATAGKKVPVGGRTRFNAGSVTKPFTAFGVLKLVEEGRFELDAPVFQHVSRWSLPKTELDASGVTVARLLSHTAGIFGDGLSDWRPNDTLPPIEKSLSGVAGARGVRLRWPPGERWAYANGGYALLQLLVIETTARDFEDYVRESVFAPLGLARSSLVIDDRVLADLATPHHPKDQRTWLAHRRVTSTGGLHTTVEDLARFAVALCDLDSDKPAGRGVLKPASVAKMLTAAAATNGRWGLGLSLEELAPDVRVAGHSGGSWGFGADLWFDPDRGNGYAILGNSTNAGEVLAPIREAWLRWYAASIERRAPEIHINGEQRRWIGTWQGNIVTPKKRVPIKILLSTTSGGRIAGDLVNKKGVLRSLRILSLTPTELSATVVKMPEVYVRLVRTGEFAKGDWFEVRRHGLELKKD